MFVSVRQCGHLSTFQHWWQRISPAHLTESSGKPSSSYQATTTVWATWKTGELTGRCLITYKTLRFFIASPKAPFHCAHPYLSVLLRILSDWLESKFSGDRELKSSDEQLDGTLKTLCVIDTLQEKEECIHRVYISIKVRADCSSFLWLRSKRNQSLKSWPLEHFVVWDFTSLRMLQRLTNIVDICN